MTEADFFWLYMLLAVLSIFSLGALFGTSWADRRQLRKFTRRSE